MIGGYDLKKYAQKDSNHVQWNNLANEHYWSVNLDRAELNFDKNKTHFKKFSKPTLAVFDSGTKYILMPSDDHSNILIEFYEKLGISFEEN